MIKKYLSNTRFILAFILIVGLFFRTYQIIERFEYAHDADLYSWIVKDILVNHHFRLIGQLTTAPGIFIGPLFYYLLVPFYAIFNMSPVGALVPTTILGMITIYCYYWVFNKLFNDKVGLIAAFLDAVLIWQVGFDRWVVPTVLTNIWSVWYFYCLIQIVRGNYRVLWILGILIGLIWHIHIALIPIQVALIVAIILSRKLPTKKQILLFLTTLFISSIPLLSFELRHNFQQFFSLLWNLNQDFGGGRGIEKLRLILIKVSINTNALVLAPQQLPDILNHLFSAGILLSGLLSVKLKILEKKEFLVILSWIIGAMIFFSVSSTIISEYYFANFNVLIIALIALVLTGVVNHSPKLRPIILLILIFVLIKNFYFFIIYEPYKKGYLERQNLVTAIKKDTEANNYPCISVSYVNKPGENFGFRYLLWVNGLILNKIGEGAPIYNIVSPEELSQDPQKLKFGHLGLLLPQGKDLMKPGYKCSPDINVTDSMFGYTE